MVLGCVRGGGVEDPPGERQIAFRKPGSCTFDGLKAPKKSKSKITESARVGGKRKRGGTLQPAKPMVDINGR